MKELIFPGYSLTTIFIIILIFMLLRYFSLAGLAYHLVKRFPERKIASTDSGSHIAQDILWSVLSTLIFALSGTWLIHLLQTGSIDIYTEAGKYGYLYLGMSLFILMFFHDFYFYWTHRLLHLPWLFKRFHLAHHKSRIPTAWTAFSFHPVEAFLQAIILPVLLMIFPTHGVVVIAFLSIMTVLGIINHLGHEFYSESFRSHSFSSFIISASHHQLHHQKVRLNYGLYFNFWDVWMKTEAKSDK